jgi:hypothetical protein
VQPVSRQPPVAADARRIARSSAWEVGSPVASRSLAAMARISSPLATTAPTGTSPLFAASSAASRARRIMARSVSEGLCASGAVTKPIIAVGLSLMLLWTEPGWDHDPAFASSPSIRARISSRTFPNVRVLDTSLGLIPAGQLQHLIRHVDTIGCPPGATRLAESNTPIPPPLPRSSTTSPGESAASATGFPHPSEASAASCGNLLLAASAYLSHTRCFKPSFITTTHIKIG